MIRRNIFWNLIGLVLPLLAGFFLFPLIISTYGLERFGLLTLAWSIVGYFSLFDLGLSRALTQLISERIDSRSKHDEIQSLVSTTFIVMWGLGIIGALFLYASSPYLVNHFLHLSASLSIESIRGFSVLAVAIPFLVHTASLRGVLESQQRFKVVSAIRTVLGVGTFLAPYAAAVYGANLVNACYSLVILRVIVWTLYVLAFNYGRTFRFNLSVIDRKWLSPLFRFGTWMTVSNLISPVMDYLDRFLIVSVLGSVAVSYYVAPFEVLTKLLVLASAIAGVLFPFFAGSWKKDQLRSAEILGQTISYILVLIYPIVLVLCVLSNQWLSAWLGKEFSENASYVVTWLGLGILLNSVAQIFFAKVQGAGRSDWTAKLHLIELPIYLVIVWFGLKYYGIKGAAFAWFIRMFIDLLGLIYFSEKLNSHVRDFIYKPIVLMFFGLLSLVIVSSINDLFWRLFLALTILFIYSFVTIRLFIRDNLFVLIKTYLYERKYHKD